MSKGSLGPSQHREDLTIFPTLADSVKLAAAVFDAAAFVTISWETDQEARDRGSVASRISCSKCHGYGGCGEGNSVFQGDTLRPPSFLTADWRFTEDPLGLREQIFPGSVAGMPYWGLVGLRKRDVDAVARYIVDHLRPTYGGM